MCFGRASIRSRICIFVQPISVPSQESGCPLPPTQLGHDSLGADEACRLSCRRGKCTLASNSPARVQHLAIFADNSCARSAASHSNDTAQQVLPVLHFPHQMPRNISCMFPLAPLLQHGQSPLPRPSFHHQKMRIFLLLSLLPHSQKFRLCNKIFCRTNSIFSLFSEQDCPANISCTAGSGTTLFWGAILTK